MHGESTPPNANSSHSERKTLARILQEGENEPSMAESVLRAADILALTINDANQRAATAEEALVRAEGELSVDPDTGLWTEHKFDREVDAWARREGMSLDTQIAIVFIDMNNLKAINDAHGHAAGDAAISELADKLRNLTEHGMRTDDFSAVSRSNNAGDEFLLALPAREITDVREGTDGDDLRAALREKLNALIAAGYEDNYYATGCAIATRGELLEYGLPLYKEMADAQMYKNKERMKKGPRTRIGKKLIKPKPPYIAL